MRLTAVRATHNPAGALDALFVLTGDARREPIECIDGVDQTATAAHGRRARRLRILHFNDLHNALIGLDARGAPVPLFSRIVRRYRVARSAAGDDEVVLLLSGGDDHTGTPFDELLGWSRAEFVLDPAYAAYSAAGVDAATLGNHDLDRGSAVLAAGIESSARFPILSANIAGAAALAADRHYFPGAIGVAKGMRIGFVGLTTPIDTRTHTADDPGFVVTSPLQALRHLVPAVAAVSDIVIVMSHCGYGVDSHRMHSALGAGFLAEGDIAIARLAATLTTRPVLVLGAHSHTVLNADRCSVDTVIDGVPIVQAGGHGSHLGEFEATLGAEGSRASWRFTARLHQLSGRVRGGAHDASGDALADADWAFEEAVLAPMRARLRRRTEEVLAVVGGDADLSRDTTLRQRYCGECALVNFVCDALVARSSEFPQGPVALAIVNSTAIADGVRAQRTLTFNDWYRVQPFADTLQVAEITGSQLLSILASNAQRVLRPEELQGTGAADPQGYVSRGFLHFSRALRYTLRLNGNACEAAVANVTFDGRPLEAGDTSTIRVVFTNYLGAGGYAESWNGNAIGAGVLGFLPGYDLRSIAKHDTGLVFRNEVIAYLRSVGRLDPATGARLDGRLVVE